MASMTNITINERKSTISLSRHNLIISKLFMFTTTTTTTLASQAEVINRHKNANKKILVCNGSLYLNQLCEGKNNLFPRKAEKVFLVHVRSHDEINTK